jgi:uncharacterized Zn-finger protein
MGIIRTPTGSTAPAARKLVPKGDTDPMQPFEIVYVKTDVVACDGGGGVDGHPKVYLNLSAEGKIECPYCSRLFVPESKRGEPLAAGPVAGGPQAAPKP